jgi:hypothetical protein
MTLFVEPPNDDGEAWEICLAKQCLTDILVQVRKSGEQWATVAFKIGELVCEEIEGDGDLGGPLQVSDERAANLARWAAQLELYAGIVRSALKCRRPPP